MHGMQALCDENRHLKFYCQSYYLHCCFAFSHVFHLLLRKCDSALPEKHVGCTVNGLQLIAILHLTCMAPNSCSAQWSGKDLVLAWTTVCKVQASAELPQSGVATSDTWQALLGKDAKPSDAAKLALENETDDDMTADHGGVYLVGEQRWARTS